ncbi:FKBP-type peptidyl-prolyl cis-trans isomerase [Parvularcula lutaonensis]|uniref:peptidylprolyl isomerase n=1 Tax=Parvularcula lutaonensis TaxID=491923 RepID=A0ABV7MCB9_9PROT|nr:FKBP-type peptidyl-prolyl cis-trans isomerase [Parvularcula lutaonensis]GGY50421.1 hypothetical protein GCM10007148_19030 [Parvularcula lutaonensis]
MERLVFLTTAVSALALAACGGGENAADATSGNTTEATIEAPGAFSTSLPEETGPGFLATFAELPDTTTSSTGLVMQTFEEGTGASPDDDDLVRIHFVARVAGNQEPFESTYENGAPVIAVPAQTLPGWAEALKMMKEGGKARIAVPPELAFGAQGMPGGPVGPNAITVYDIELLEVIPSDDEAALNALAEEAEAKAKEYAEEAQRQQSLAQQQVQAIASVNAARGNIFVNDQAARPETSVTPSGLVYEVVTDAPEGATPKMGDQVTVHYRGTLPDGTEFDSSHSRGQPATFTLGEVIQGWNEGLQLMNVGDTYRFYIPANLAYGQRGAGDVIGPNQALVFEVELLDVTPAQPAETEE